MCVFNVELLDKFLILVYIVHIAADFSPVKCLPALSTLVRLLIGMNDLMSTQS